MNTYRVENATCGHCVRTIETAIHAVDATAIVDVALATGIVRIEGGTTDSASTASAISNAGYPAAPVDDGASAVANNRSARRACCCG